MSMSLGYIYIPWKKCTSKYLLISFWCLQMKQHVWMIIQIKKIKYTLYFYKMREWQILYFFQCWLPFWDQAIKKHSQQNVFLSSLLISPLPNQHKDFLNQVIENQRKQSSVIFFPPQNTLLVLTLKQPFLVL